MKKLISAQSILREKGFVQSKFDTNGFMQAVGQFFLDNSVQARLLLVPFRFLDIRHDEPYDHYNNAFGITPDEEKLGYKVQTARNSKGNIDFIEAMFEGDFDEYAYERDAGILFPRIIIDKPFFENAASLLRLMGGFVVEKQVKKKRKLYWVTLI